LAFTTLISIPNPVRHFKPAKDFKRREGRAEGTAPYFVLNGRDFGDTWAGNIPLPPVRAFDKHELLAITSKMFLAATYHRIYKMLIL
jgi:hypothetical protein